MRSDTYARNMLLCSASESQQLDWLRGHGGLGYGGWSIDLLATLADGVGTGFAGLLVEELADNTYHYADTLKLVYGALAELASVDAIRAMLDHVDDKVARTSVLAAARRSPAGALEPMAEAANGTGKPALAARRLLAAHIRGRHELVAATLPKLPPELAAVVASLVETTARVEEAPEEALPTLLVSPPWTRPRVRPARGAAVPGPVPADIRRVVWRPDEGEQWAATATGFRDYHPADALVATLPAAIPEVPEWAEPAALPQIRLRDGRGALPRRYGWSRSRR
ncbi:hypothetical protein [Embleya sp. NBC_00896]|uniref:hypothetical protein n=1 Tax=Embleya sp. NBC_00896 TaxID=2975961 RepID=UPI002F906CC2|nr:hypothetical protein OG928_42190 [Embleya sp. NBC_00896]